jgi:hypothetical protein
MWGLLAFYTRDLRLANLSEKTGELGYCQYYIDLSNDLLSADIIEAVPITISRAATRMELSQSKGGFLRKILTTLRNVNISRSSEEPSKKSLMGLGKVN